MFGGLSPIREVFFKYHPIHFLRLLWMLGRRKFFAGIHYYRTLEYPLADRFLPVKDGDRVLEIGVGYSCFCYCQAVRHNIKMDIVDDESNQDQTKEIYQRSIDVLEKRYPGIETRINHHITPSTSLPFDDATFQVAYAISSVEHVKPDDDIELIQEIYRVLAPGGTLLMTAPFAFDGDEHLVDNPCPEKFWQLAFTPRRIFERFVAPTGFRVVKSVFWGERYLGKNPQRYYQWMRLPSRFRACFGWMLTMLSSLLWEVYHIYDGDSILTAERHPKRWAGDILILLKKQA